MAGKTNLTGTKFFIAAGALTGTVGGWIMLSLTGAGGAANGMGLFQDPAIVDLVHQPLPTLAAPNVQAIPADPNQQTAPGVQPPAVPTLRSVNQQPVVAPPPVTNTQSSR